MGIVASQLVAEVKVTGDAEAKQKLGSVSGTVDKVAGGFKDMLGNALSFAAGQAVFTGVGDAVGFLKDKLTDAFHESMDAQAGMALTNAVLKSTHDASGETAQGIADLAGNLSHLTKFSDDTTQAAENMLLTFTNIGKNVFPQATKTVLDMSQALGQDTKSSAIQLGKALNDPITGVSALQRVGVTFNQTQKDLIGSYIKHGDTAKAQGVILKELQKEFGGAAEAAGKTFGGQLVIAHQYLADIEQNIGDALMPLLTGFLGTVEKDGLPILQKFSDWFTKDGIPALQNLAGEIGPLVGDVENFAGSVLDTFNNSGALQSVLQTIHDILPDVEDFFKNTADTLETKLLPPVLDLVSNFSTWLDKSGILKDSLHLLDDVVSTVATDAGGFVQDLSNLFGWLNQNQGASYGLKDAIFAIGGVIAGVKILQFGKDVFSTMKDATGNVKDFIGEVGKIKDKLGDVLDFFTGKFKNDSGTALSSVGKDADSASGSVAGIGKSAETSAAEVATASTEEETSLAGVATKAEAADVSIAAIGTSSVTAEAEAAPAISGLTRGFAGILGLTALIPLNIMSFQNAMDSAWQDVKSQNWSAFFANFGGGNVGGALGVTISLAQHSNDNPPVFEHSPGARGKATGGPVSSGWFLAGEKGPELIHAGGSGYVYNNAQTMGMLAGMGSSAASSFPGIHAPMLGASLVESGNNGGYQGPREVILQIEGHQLARLMMPHITNQIRYSVNSRVS